MGYTEAWGEQPRCTHFPLSIDSQRRTRPLREAKIVIPFDHIAFHFDSRDQDQTRKKSFHVLLDSTIYSYFRVLCELVFISGN